MMLSYRQYQWQVNLLKTELGWYECVREDLYFTVRTLSYCADWTDWNQLLPVSYCRRCSENPTQDPHS